MLRNCFAEGVYTHENKEVLQAAYQELEKRVGGNIVTLNGNIIVLRYPQVAYEEVALPIVKKHKLERCTN